MGCNQLVILATIAIVLPTIVMATEYIVGDSNQWRNNNFDYQNWAKDKVFRVGDVLVFKYPAEKHNVVKVDGEGFKNCEAAKENAPLVSGEDEIRFLSPGKKWYICSVGSHCATAGQKLAVEVVADDSPKTNSAPTILSSGYQVFAAVLATIAVAVVLYE